MRLVVSDIGAYRSPRKPLVPGAMLRPGAIQQGMQVVAVYREQENGSKILTRLAPGR